MKLSTCLFLFAAAASVRADLVMVQETSLNGVKSRTTMSIKGNLMRTDNGTETSVIMDSDTGDITTLMHEDKMVMTMSGAVVKAAQANVPPVKIEPPKLTATGKKETVDGYECEIYTLESGGSVATMWVAKSYPGYEKLQKQLEPMTKMGSAGVKQPEIPGMTLKTETTSSGLKFVTTLVSLKEEKVDPAIFKVPANYKKQG